MNIQLQDAIYPGVKVWNGREDYEAANGPAPADKTGEPEKRWTLAIDEPSRSLTFLTVENGVIVSRTRSLTKEYLAATNFSGRSKFPTWADYVSKLQRVRATVVDPDGEFFGLQADRPVDPVEYFLFTTKAQADAVAAQIGRGGKAEENPLLDSAELVYAADELRRIYVIKTIGTVSYTVGELLRMQAQDDVSKAHTGGVGQPGSFLMDANGVVTFIPNTSVPQNAAMIPPPVQIPAGYEPVPVVQIGSPIPVIQFAPIAAPVAAGSATLDEILAVVNRIAVKEGV